MIEKAEILRLARSGGLERAWALLEQSGLAAANSDPAALTLKARLVKDRATRAEGAERARLFGESGALYEHAASLAPGSYPLINAASLALLSGNPGHARALAQEVLALLEANSSDAETPYWLGATRAEALLLLDRASEARSALQAAIELAPRAWEDHAATLRQLTLLCGELGQDGGWLDKIRPPASICFSGIMALGKDAGETQEEIAEWLDHENVGFGYGALAAGADILIARLLIERGAELHLVFPCPVDLFRERSVVAAAPEWGGQFDLLLGEAASVVELGLTEDLTIAAVVLAEHVATGLAIENARRLQSRALALRVAPLSESPANGQSTLSVPIKYIGVDRGDPGSGMKLREGEAYSFVVVRSDDQQELRYADGGSAILAAREAKASSVAVALGVEFENSHEFGIGLTELLEVAQPGQAFATRPAAFALLGRTPQIRVEEMGEVQTSRGRFAFCAII